MNRVLPTLDDAWAKLGWAEENYNVLRREIEAVEQRDFHRISVQVDQEAGEYVFYVHDLPETPTPHGACGSATACTMREPHWTT